MKKRFLFLGLLGLISAASLRHNLLPPDPMSLSSICTALILLHRYQNQIGLETAQKMWLQDELEKARKEIAPLQEQLQKQKQALGQRLKGEQVDEIGALALADRALVTDQKIKRAELVLLIHIKNKLTAEQQAKLDQIKAQTLVIQEKLRKVQELARQQQTQGKDLAALQPLREAFESQIKTADLPAADSTADKMLQFSKASS